MSALDPDPGDWRAAAACRGMDPDLWFPPPPGYSRAEPGDYGATAKAICARCPVTDECLACALASPWAVVGIWGGTTERGRRALERSRQDGRRRRWARLP